MTPNHALDETNASTQSQQGPHQTGAAQPADGYPGEARAQDYDSVDIQTDLNHINGSDIRIAGHNVITIQVDTARQAIELVKALKEEEDAKHIAPLPSPDAPLQERVNHWFQSTLRNDRERYFVVTLSMFSGLKYPDFLEIYTTVLQSMHVTEVEEDDTPRSQFALTDDDLIERSEAKVVRSEDGLEDILLFKDDRYVSAVFDLMRRRYRGVLLNLLPALKEIGERYRYWQVRTRSALAVAEIGKMSFQRVRSLVLEPWASDPRAYVRATVGYPLARLVEDEVSQVAARNMLQNWIDDSGYTWHYRWTAASVFKQIGTTETHETRDWVYKGLSQLAGFDDIRIGDSVIHSMVVLSLQGQLERVLGEIKQWIEQGSAGSNAELAPRVRCILAILTFMVLTEVHIELATGEREDAHQIRARPSNLFNLVYQSKKDQGDYWQLAVAVGVRAFEFRLANTFFTLIERWTRYAADRSYLQDVVRNLLVEVFMRARPLQREHIWNRLGMWQHQGKDLHLSEMAISAKAEIRNQVLGEPPNHGRIVFGT